MDNKLTTVQNGINASLGQAIDNATTIITKDYLAELETYELMPLTAEQQDIDIVECGKFYKLSKLVLNKEENFLHKLTTIVNVVSSIGCSLVTVVKSDGMSIDYYVGIVSKNARDNKEVSSRRREANALAFKGALSGNLMGSELEMLSEEEMRDFRTNVLMKKNSCFASVSGIVALRNKEVENVISYVQGIENVVDSLRGQKYSIVMLADPITSAEIQNMKMGYEMLHTQLSTFAKSVVTLNESDSVSLSKARTDGITKGLTTGVAMTQSQTKSKGTYGGVSVSAGINIGVQASVGSNAGMSRSTADTSGETRSRMESRQTNESVTRSAGTAKMEGKSLQLSYENRSIKSLLDKIDKQLVRLEECESFSAFNCATYVISDQRETTVTVAGNYNALMRGQGSYIQASHINTWYKPEDTIKLNTYMASMSHPRFKCKNKDGNKGGDIVVTPASIISGDELAIQVGLPKKSIAGITVIPMAAFGRNIITSGDKKIEIGALHHMGNDEGSKYTKQRVPLDIESLASHTFITGSTGAGKSTAIYSILDKLMKESVKGKNQKVKFMVIEPTKGEYKDRFGEYKDVYVYGTNHKKMPLLRLNPFSFPEDIHVLEHIDRLIEIFNVCWPMYAAMPAVLKDSIERAYLTAGWNLEESECSQVNSIGRPLFPIFSDVLEQIETVMEESQYSADSKSDYKGALMTRIKSLTNGLYSKIFTSNELSSEELFDENVIVDLSRTGSSETKALIMGILVMKLGEYRMANAVCGNAPLQHITVLEEAHHILKNITLSGTASEGANLTGKSVEMLANSIAEMRTYGEGFMIADQSPGLMDLSVIRNTNTKIILRLPSLADRELLGRAVGLNEEQIMELSRLQTFVAAVYQNNWLEPVLCNIDTYFQDTKEYKLEGKQELFDYKEEVIKFLLIPASKRYELDRAYVDKLCDYVYTLDVPSEVKIDFKQYIDEREKEQIRKLRAKIIYYLCNAETAFKLSKSKQKNIEMWYETMKGYLQPNLSVFEIEEQQKIMALITKEQVNLEANVENHQLFEALMKYM